MWSNRSSPIPVSEGAQVTRRWRKVLGLIALAAVLLLSSLAAPLSASAQRAATPAAASARATLDLGLYETRVLHQVNRRRTAHGLRPVRRVDPCVDRLSDRWAAHLASTLDFLHRDQRVILRRCHMYWAGETLARGTAMTPSGAVVAWMHSPDHRPILLKKRANRGGVGARLDAQGRILLVLNFSDTRS